MPEPVIRPATHADDEVLAELDRRAWSPLHAVKPRPRAPYEPFFDARHPPEHLLVAEAAETEEGAAGEGGRAAATGPRLVGYIRLAPATRLVCNAHVRQIQGLVVDDRFRGRGVARAMLRAACAEARRQGALRVTLRVLGHNAPARALYASEGFAVEGVLPGEFLLDGAYVDDVLMGRTL
ncbi:GNAT family N-acetyltransferase [Streptomyces netropsis]|uniref:RimJ/RimL family protein N-acetyltransferase n=1 Tax=Streptomyces netropsis TaxID=55404 RepID=A0A7W7L6R9_STRNE|nr:GNAT family N-acetyltransferase [Streptomyces netropsis]MBB4884648.1 RimJ/RimL family protein N-acetyltransferase [Streptomyces netropsis]